MDWRLTTEGVGTGANPRKERLCEVTPPRLPVPARDITERFVQGRDLGVEGDRLDAELGRLRLGGSAQGRADTAPAQIVGDEHVVQAAHACGHVQPGVAGEAPALAR